MNTNANHLYGRGIIIELQDQIICPPLTPYPTTRLKWLHFPIVRFVLINSTSAALVFRQNKYDHKLLKDLCAEIVYSRNKTYLFIVEFFFSISQEEQFGQLLFCFKNINYT